VAEESVEAEEGKSGVEESKAPTSSDLDGQKEEEKTTGNVQEEQPVNEVDARRDDTQVVLDAKE